MGVRVKVRVGVGVWVRVVEAGRGDWERESVEESEGIHG